MLHIPDFVIKFFLKEPFGTGLHKLNCCMTIICHIICGLVLVLSPSIPVRIFAFVLYSISQIVLFGFFMFFYLEFERNE